MANQFNLAKPYSLYNDLQNYNEGTPDLPPTVPSSKFQTILDQPTINSPYSILTYHSNEKSYPTVEHAYPVAEPKYVVMKEPAGKIVREFQANKKMESTTPKPNMNQKTCNVENMPIVERFNHDDSLKDLDIILFVDKKCKFCMKQLHHPFSKHFQQKDIKIRENKQMFTNHGGFATPYFVSKKTNKTFTGVLDSPQKVIQALSSKEHFSTGTTNSIQQKIKDLDIVVYSSPACPHCTNFKSLCKSENVLPSMRFVEDISQMKDVKDIKGFPTIVSNQTKKSITGAPPNLQTLADYLS